MILAVFVDPVVLGGMMAFGSAVVLGLFGWVLTQVIALARQMAVNAEQLGDHDRRITWLESRYDT